MKNSFIQYKNIYDNTKISVEADKKIKSALESLPSPKRMKKIKIAAAIVFLCICSMFLITTHKNISTPPLSIGWNNSFYGPSGQEVSQSELGKQLGEIKRIKKPIPIENGDSNDIYIPVGSKIFEIKSVDINEAIAIERDGKKYKFIKKDSFK